jgi:L,D-peptidoglycan transpeptidase YkuD (ErfK/YbiS/YcfS/YnhG family)
LEEATGAGQAVVVTAEAYGVSTATLTAYERQAGRWRRAMGPWTARIGSRGFAPPDEKVEGDGRTPSGVYQFSFLFGVAPDPGVRFEYRQVPDDTIVWDEDPSSPTYNLWIDLDDYGGGRDAEGMYQPVAYRYGAVIAYNTARTPGRGSGIFLHASTGRATAGCVSLPVDQLVALLRWLDPARSPRIVMGVV